MRVFFSLGSNLGDKKALVDEAVSSINKKVGKVISRSSFYETEPWGFQSEHSFYNICCCCETTLSPLEVLTVTQGIEKEMGRKKKSVHKHYQDRCIDIDLLFCDDAVIDTERLTIPHPLLQKRLFVLEPLNEIAPTMEHPVLHRTVQELLAALRQSSKPNKE